jgi:hypothetical protein
MEIPHYPKLSMAIRQLLGDTGDIVDRRRDVGAPRPSNAMGPHMWEPLGRGPYSNPLMSLLFNVAENPPPPHKPIFFPPGSSLGRLQKGIPRPSPNRRSVRRG